MDFWVEMFPEVMNGVVFLELWRTDAMRNAEPCERFVIFVENDRSNPFALVLR